MIFTKICTRFILSILVLTTVIAVFQTSMILNANYNDTPQGISDLITILPGDDQRIKAGHFLAEKGLSTNLLIVNQSPDDFNDIEQKYGKIDQLLFFSTTSRSTFEDVYALQKTVTAHKFASVIVVTSAYHLPRTIFLFECLQFFTNQEIETQYYAVSTPNPPSLSQQINTNTTEVIKFWGSLVELSFYLTTGSLLRDRPEIDKMIGAFKWKFLYRLLPPSQS